MSDSIVPSCGSIILQLGDILPALHATLVLRLSVRAFHWKLALCPRSYIGVEALFNGDVVSTIPGGTFTEQDGSVVTGYQTCTHF